MPGAGRRRVAAESPCREDLEGMTAVDWDLDGKCVMDPRLNRECMALREAYKGYGDMFFKATRSGAADAGWRASSSSSTRAPPSTISLFQQIRL